MFDWGLNEQGFDHGMIGDMNKRSIWRWDVRIVDVGGDALYLNHFNIERRDSANFGGPVVAGFRWRGN